MCAKVGLFVLFAALGASPAQAEGWTAIWKIDNGNCGQDVVVTVTETPELLHMQSDGNKTGIRPYTRDVKLAADGSGILEFKSDAFGAIKMVVPPGRGPRLITQGQVNNICRWTLHPR